MPDAVNEPDSSRQQDVSLCRPAIDHNVVGLLLYHCPARSAGDLPQRSANPDLMHVRTHLHKVDIPNTVHRFYRQSPLFNSNCRDIPGMQMRGWPPAERPRMPFGTLIDMQKMVCAIEFNIQHLSRCIVQLKPSHVTQFKSINNLTIIRWAC